MEYVLSHADFRSLEILALLTSSLSFGMACVLRQKNEGTGLARRLKIFLPVSFGTALWTIHFTVVLRTLASPGMAVSIVSCLASFAVMVASVFLALKAIEKRFRYSTYISGSAFGAGTVFSHLIDRNSIHILQRCVGENCHAGDDIFGTALLGASFILLWSGMIGYFLDYYGTKEVLAHLHERANTDKLTGLANRSCLDERFPDILKNAQNNGGTIGCLVIDLNNFKDINDQYGHLCGDEILRSMGENLRDRYRGSDIFIARLGGDEFIAICPYENMEDFQTFARDLYDLLCQPREIEGRSLKTGCCVGISFFPSDGETQNALMKAADLAMYEIKKKRLDGISFYKDLLRS